MRLAFVNPFLVVFCLFGVCSCSRSESEEVARLKKELEAAKQELAQLKAANKDGGNPSAKDDGLLIQSGEINLDSEEVFYPRPYANPPALKIDNKDSNLIVYEIAEQRRDGFRLKIAATSNKGPPARYEARGVAAK